MRVLKFGGTSVASPENIQRVKDILENNKASRQAVVVSAFGGITDLLLNISEFAANQDESYKKGLEEIESRHIAAIKELIPIQKQSAILSKVKSDLNVLETLLEGSFLIGELTPKLSDKIVSYGELLSAFIISEYLKSQNLDATFKDSRELIVTDKNFGKASVNFSETNQNCSQYFEKSSQSITILPGFVASSLFGDSTTLGRGGSDYSAAIYAAALNAEVLEIWTDVSGMFTANPKLVKQAKSVSHISYEEAMELSHFGAKVLYPPTIQPVLDKGIPIVIKNTFAPQDTGTHISASANGTGKSVRGISHVDKITLISLEGPGMVGIPGISKRFFETLALGGISIVLITQASSEHSICVGISEEDAERAEEALNAAFAYEISIRKLKPVQVEKDLAIVALVGENMKSHQGLSGKMFSTLGKNNVNIRAIAQGASERNISAVIEKTDVKKALNSLHERFFEENIKQLNLFVMGVGNVGSRFLEQIKQQRNYIKKELKLNLRVIAISNSRTMFFDEEGISLKKWPELLSSGAPADTGQFFEKIKELNYRNSVFVDNTASDSIALTYPEYLKNSISVVTCNKIACSSDFDFYKELKSLSKKYNAPFLFETNVGAGLPIIDTLKHLIVSGDKVHKIQAVLSGSLNFVFNNFNDSTTFHDVVKQAQEEGYTEPDPTIDLSGIDVMRKILILARESGHQIDIEDITNDSFLPEESLQSDSNEAFFESLKKYESDFQQLYKEARDADTKLKYVAEFADGKAKIGLSQIPKGHDFYNLEGSDNVVLFFTERYPNQPLIIKGAGAGAEVTASGIFADIIRIGNF
ncbi:bifunctional aspartate kinase/homoserine dehydrogenase I [Flagellimonas allohymeniacidonis]|uniref:Bifunctional aspartate kinase/homoserine dehydrogenase I n=1 Tax=Flagellimonas allohymeniacidonis TaxID=2517819 RepID=A0A4Q8QEU0_9FLAO|nr:bifunctional aspartate kinase/homoserine dehydrogenase I [Allomuricauda hymeniacidonis]TAI48334.1 bifunctional aspartate kinase/homoserine dehydrogenase I [Allomuricauda hymeniacidonis]